MNPGLAAGAWVLAPAGTFRALATTRNPTVSTRISVAPKIAARQSHKDRSRSTGTILKTCSRCVEPGTWSEAQQGRNAPEAVEIVSNRGTHVSPDNRIVSSAFSTIGVGNSEGSRLM